MEILYESKIEELSVKFKRDRKRDSLNRSNTNTSIAGLQDEVVELNRTIALNDLKTQKLQVSAHADEEIKVNTIKIEKNNLEIKMQEQELESYQLRLIVYRYKLKELYLELMINPENML